MKRSITVMTTSLALLILGLAFSVGTAVAQSAKDLVGTWTPVSAEVFDPNPKGNLTFDANGRFSLQLLRADLKKIAANKRDLGTPEENTAIVHGSISYYGTYTMNGTELVLHVEASSFPNWTGTDQKRTNVSLTADQLTYTNPSPSGWSRNAHYTGVETSASSARKLNRVTSRLAPLGFGRGALFGHK
ncbi:lipocalin-like domain-containing protein [Bradyrhizobium sp. AZCC 2289]|uniref:lipocalin-like domain-containing protein n=1 Tax=Bradyrhizobium sp. AZCC 2289 TaxID=3117026 RepID=UPI002FEEA58B